MLGIIGSQYDPHLLRVSQVLEKDKILCGFFDLYETSNILVDYSEKDSLFFDFETLCGQRLSVSKIHPMLWFRNKFQMEDVKKKSDQASFFGSYERFAFLTAALDVLELETFNSIAAMRKANSKIRQLYSANTAGLNTPRTIISNNRQKVLSFLSEIGGEAITKPLSRSYIPAALDGSAEAIKLMCNSVNSDIISNAHEDEFSIAPSIYQENLDKDYELKIIMFLGKSCWYRIDATRTTYGKTDWRLGYSELEYAGHDRNEEVDQKLSTYLDREGLHYGVFDFVRTKNGDLVFLECNVDGQWAWLEDETGRDDITQLFGCGIKEMLC